MKPMLAFALRFGGKLDLNRQLILEKNQQYFLLSPTLRKLTRGTFFTAGVYLGSVQEGSFSPSFNLLNMIAATSSKKIVVDGKSAWLFICGRDVLKKGVIRLSGISRIGDYALVQNAYNECLGYGIVAAVLDGASGSDVVVRNVLDIGDFLRRES